MSPEVRRAAVSAIDEISVISWPSVTAIGIGVGVVGALFLTRLLQSLFFEVQPTDALTYVVVSAVLGSVTVLAMVPAGPRATRADPIAVLRSD